MRLTKPFAGMLQPLPNSDTMIMTEPKKLLSRLLYALASSTALFLISLTGLTALNLAVAYGIGFGDCGSGSGDAYFFYVGLALEVVVILPISLCIGIVALVAPPRFTRKLILEGLVTFLGGVTLLFVASFIYSALARGTCGGLSHLSDSPIECTTELHCGFFFDGTGNHRERNTPLQKQTNVERLYNVVEVERLPGGTRQITFANYAAGVGTPFNEEVGNTLRRRLS